ncbi:5'-methylthioadenosine/adenosylhomocysteine nucleosidase [Entomomonas asaccharolytica]|uniref:5'-methylthioadenosine/S-adenosylhomocysteine nucleosidase n=1 Tax=Entomomonas asaccharolytica TaxID=2785331 RepID=A0A974NH49_9GAMM|nr:5'-methylthioadenosine/adenosylhomocysteine nucleosidase [Entomomonas asaccharolytica]QQP86563.1 5'-methylthioadenosine/adenosylhomocysteine nucleosidase [Entomomonas asaccharolytica]
MSDKKVVDIAIIGAMAEEVEALVSYLTEAALYEKLSSVYYLGKLVDKEVVVFQSGVGKVGAALSTAYVLEHFSPKFVINIGSAGGFDPKLSVGDVVISSEVRYHDVDVTLVGCEYGQIPNMPAAFEANKQLVEVAQNVVQQHSNHKAMTGLICTGDCFMSDKAVVKLVRNRFPEMIAADMEAAAVGHTCYLYDCPFVVIRAISDVVDQPDNKIDFFSFLQIAARNSADIVANMVKQLN